MSGRRDEFDRVSVVVREDGTWQRQRIQMGEKLFGALRGISDRCRDVMGCDRGFGTDLEESSRDRFGPVVGGAGEEGKVGESQRQKMASCQTACLLEIG